MSAYADTSFLLPLYVPDVHSRRTVAALTSFSAPVLLTPLNELEMINAVHLRCFRREITLTECRQILSSFDADRSAGNYSLSPIPDEAFGTAIRLAMHHSASIGSRSLDILHVASALCLGATTFLTFDKVQSRLASLEGLKTL